MTLALRAPARQQWKHRFRSLDTRARLTVLGARIHNRAQAKHPHVFAIFFLPALRDEL